MGGVGDRASAPKESARLGAETPASEALLERDGAALNFPTPGRARQHIPAGPNPRDLCRTTARLDWRRSSPALINPELPCSSSALLALAFVDGWMRPPGQCYPELAIPESGTQKSAASPRDSRASRRFSGRGSGR